MSHPQRSSLFRRLLKSFTTHRRKLHQRLRRRRLAGSELLESRALLATITWGNVNGGNWNVPANWVGGVVPGAADDAVIPDLPGTPTISFTNGTAVVKSFTTREAFVMSGGAFNATNISQLGGSITIAGGVLGATTLAAGTATITGNVSLYGFTVAAGATLNVANNVSVFVQSGTPLNVFGSASFGTGSTLSLQQTSGLNAPSQLIIGNQGVVTTTNATITSGGNRSERPFMEIQDGGRLRASDSTFSVPLIRMGNNAILNPGDWARNRFDTAIYMPHTLIGMLSAAGGGSDNVRFDDIFISSGTLSTGALDLRSIGTGTTANLDYWFNGNFTIANGASLNVFAGVRSWTVSGSILTIGGSANFAAGSSLSLNQTSGLNAPSQLVIRNQAVVTATNAVINSSGNRSELPFIDVQNGGRLRATDSTFFLPAIYLGNSAILNSGDWARNRFDTSIFMPHTLIGMLSAAGGGSDNLRFNDIYINSGTLSAGSLNLRPIGTETTANLDYSFNSHFTIANGATLNVFPGVRSWTESGSILTIAGSANFAAGSSLSLHQSSGLNAPSQLVITNQAVVTATTATITSSGSRRELPFIDVQNGGRLIATDSTISPAYVRLGNNAILNPGDWARNRFDTSIYMPHTLIGMLSAAGGGSDNLRFNDIYIRSGTLSTGSLDLRSIGTETTANLDYSFDGNFTVANGASLNVFPGVRSWTESGSILTIAGSANFANGSSLRMQQSSGLNAPSQLVISNLAVVTATTATITSSGSRSELPFIDVQNGGRLIATDSTLSPAYIRLGNNAILNPGDWARNRFDTSIYMPHTLIGMLSAVGGGSDNLRFNDIYIRSGTLSTGSLDLRSIGTETTANLDYSFDGSFTIASGASLNVFPGVRSWTESGSILTIGGSANFAAGSSLNLQQSSGLNAPSQLVITNQAVVTATTATITSSGSRRELPFIDVQNGGRLIATDSTISPGYVRLGNNAILNPGDWARNRFDTSIYMPHTLIGMLSAAGGGSDNLRFNDIYIRSNTLNTGSLDLRAIGTETTAALDYSFDGNFTIANGAALNVFPGVRTWTETGSVLTISGSASFASGSSLTFQQTSGLNAPSQLVVNNLATVTLTGTTIGRTGSANARTLIDVKNGGTLTVRDSSIDVGTFAYGPTSNVTYAQSGTNQYFRSSNSATVLTNYRSIDLSLGSTFTVSQALQVGNSATDTASLKQTYSSTLALNSNLTGRIRTPANFTPLGRVLFNSGIIGTPQLLEVMGGDAGATSAGFTNNYAYGKVELAANTFVRLTNTDVNWNDSRAEAIYIHTLIVGAGARLDLNGQKLYVRAFQNSGTIVNGAVSVLPIVVPDGGPLAFATPTPGTIAAGTTDTWTFTAIDNAPVMIQVNPGSAGTTAAVPQVLRRVRIELLSASDVVLKTIENDFDGNLVTLGSDALTAGQNYKIRVLNHSGFPTMSGNYVITLIGINASETALSIDPDSTSASKLEGTGGSVAFTYNVTRIGDLSNTASVSWRVTGVGSNPVNPADFVGGVLPSGVVNFTSVTDITKPITINVVSDTNFENDESFAITLFNPSNAMTITQGTVTSVILNDDSPTNSDLVVSSIVVPSGARSGERVSLAWTERNIGAGTAIGNWSTLVRVVNRATGQVVYRQTPLFQSNVLTSQASVDRVVQFDLPEGAAGEGAYDVTITIDAGGNISEANVTDTGETNNTNTASFTAAAGLYPDLVIAEIVAPGSAQLSVPFSVSWRVNNTGTAPLNKTVRERLYLSTDSVVDSSDRILSTLDTAAKTPVPTGASYTQQLDVTLPLDISLPAGNYQLIVVTDFFNEQFELIETNNTLARTISIALPPLPDLIVTSIQTRGLVVAGQTVPVTWTVKNQGSASAVGPWTDRIWLSSDTIIGGDLLISSYPITTTVLPDGSIERTQDVPIPAGLAGVYWFVIGTDVLNQVQEFVSESNNFAIDDAVVTIDSRPAPNLVVDSVTALTSNLFSGQSATVEWVVRNIGNASTNSSAWEDRVYLSNDPVFSNDDVLLGRASNPSFLNNGDAYRTSLTATLPEDAVGDRYFIVVTDATNVVAETAGEIDNSLASALSQITLTPPPDLFITSVAAPRDAFEGEPINISWTVRNQGTGPTRVNQWVDQVYLSLNGRDIDASDSLLATVTRNGVLAVGEDYRMINFSVTLPENRIADEAYIIVRTDASRKVYEHSFEGNNDTSAEFATRVIARPRPDLVVDSVSVPASAIAGQPLPITFVVANPSATATRQSVWQDSVYLSTDNQLNVQSDILLATRGRSGVLGGGQTETRTFTPSLSNTLSGTFFVIVVTDVGQQVVESIENNNTTVSTNTVSIVINPPDLEVTSASITGIPFAGREVTVNYTTTNRGGSPTPVTSWTDAIYLSTDDRLDNGDRLISDRFRSGVLAVGGTESRSVNVRLPSDWLGTGFLIVRSDMRDDVYELDNANNIRSVPISVGDDRPDLVVSMFEPRLGTRELRPGSTLTFDYEVANRGLGPTYGQNWYDRLVLSSDSTLGNGDDILLSSYSSPRDLQAGQSYSRVSENVLIPRATPEGTYRLFLTTDASRLVGESNEGNNSKNSIDFTITNAPSSQVSLSDLNVVALTVPTTLASGSSLPISWTVRNINFATTSTSFWYDNVWLSKDTTIDGNDIFVGQYLRSGALGTNAQYTRTINYPVGIDVEGTYFVIVSTDATNRVLEGFGEANNERFSSPATTITLSPTPDLRVSAVTPAATAFSGRSTPVSWTVQNTGGRTATAPWLDRAYLSLDQIFDPSTDIPLGFSERSTALANGSSYTVNANMNIPAGVGGSYYLIVVTDSSNQVYERAAENNNVTVSSQLINISHSPPADLVVGNITIPANGQLNQTATISFTVTNSGSFAARGGWYDSIYLSSDDQWDIDDGYFGRVLQSSDVAPGGSYNGSLTAQLPGVVPGNYKVIIRSDIRNNVPEANEANNLKGTLNSVAMDAPELTLGTPRNGTINKGTAVYFKVTVPAGETVAIEFDGAATAGATELYTSFGTMPRRSQADHVALEPYKVDQRIVISSTQGGTYYILAVAQDMETSSSNYSITARIVPFSVFDTSYGQGGTAGFRTIAINGAKFDRSVTAELVDSQGAATRAVRYYRTSDTRLYATFDLQSLTRGTYSVRLSKGSTSENVVVTNALQVVFSTLSTDPLSLTRPDTFNRLRDTRPPAIIPVSLGWRNTTLNDVPVPLIHFSATDPFALTLEDAKSGKTLESTEFLGFQSSDGPRDILMPGEFASADFFIVPRAVPASSPPVDIHYVAEYFYNAEAAGYPWNFDLSQLDMSMLSDDQAIATINAFRQAYTSSVGTYRTALVEALQRAGEATPKDFAAANRYLLQDIFDRFVAARQTSIIGQVSLLNANIDYERLVVTLSEVGGTRTFSVAVRQDGSFVFAVLPAAQYAVRVTGGPVKAADGLTITLASGERAELNIPLSAATATAADAVGQRLPVGLAAITAPEVTVFGKINEALGGNVLARVLPQLVGINYRVELVGEAPVGFDLRPDGSFSYLSSQTNAFVVHYDLVMPDGQTRVGRLFGDEIRSRGSVALTLKNNFTRDVRALDPNDILGPEGFGDKKWISASERLQYKIRFENDPKAASSPAGLVTIEQTLDSDLDPTTVEFGSYMFGGREFTVQPKRQSINTDLDLRAEMGIYVRVFAFVDVASRKLSWTFSSISPETGTDITDPSKGFLPLNRLPPQGDGWVSYTVRAKRTATTGSVIDAQARIIFDGNAAIDTAPIFNTLDVNRPASLIASTQVIENDSRVKVVWDGEDGDGAGLSTFDVYVSANGGSYRLWLKNTALLEAEYDGLPNWIYSFITIARDNVGNAEPDSKLPDSSRPTATIVGNYTLREGIATRLNGTAKDPDGVLTAFVYEWDFDYDGGAFQVDATSATPDLMIADGPVTRTIALRVKGSAADAPYSLLTTTTVTVDNAAPTLTRQSNSVSAFVNTELRNSGTWQDAVGDDVTLSATLGSVVRNQDGTWNWRYISTVPRTGENVTITATDKDNATTSVTFTIDATVSTVTFQPQLRSSVTGLTNQRELTIPLDFGSAVINFSDDDLQLVNATITNVTDRGSGKFDVTVSATNSGEVSVVVLAGRVIDVQGRVNVATAPVTWQFVDTSNFDFGDAPNDSMSGFPQTYPTLISANGARHTPSDLKLGANVDIESDGQPSALAAGDDAVGPSATDDEDGVFFNQPILSSSFAATVSSFSVVASGNGKLDAWIDFNRDGDWNDAGEQIATNISVTSGVNVLPLAIPRGAFVGDTYGRFRISTQGNLSPVGPADDGEVEDHRITIGSVETPSDLVIDSKLIGAHRLEIVDNQLTLTANSRVFFQAIVSSIRRVSYLAANGTSEIYSFSSPGTSLFGTLLFVSASEVVTLQVTRATVDLATFGTQIVGIGRIELVSDSEQTLRFDIASIKRLNTAGTLQIKTGAKDIVPVGSAWKYSQSRSVASSLLHTFANDGARVELDHVWQWQNVVLGNDVNGNGTVEPLDALLVINQINVGSRLPQYNPSAPQDFFFADTSGDGVLSPIDALLIINHINSGGAGEGEGEAAPAEPVSSPEAVDYFFNTSWDLDRKSRDRRFFAR